MQKNLLVIISVNLDATSSLLITYCAVMLIYCTEPYVLQEKNGSFFVVIKGTGLEANFLKLTTLSSFEN
jgi:hypothetical protein